jgi:hypothetical protein
MENQSNDSNQLPNGIDLSKLDVVQPEPVRIPEALSEVPFTDIQPAPVLVVEPTPTPVVQEPVKQEEVAPVTTRPKTATQTSEWTSPLPKTSIDGGPIESDIAMLSLPGNTEEYIAQELLKLPNTELTKTDEGKHWLNILELAQDYSFPKYGMFTKTVDRTPADWRQHVKSEVGLLGPSAPNFANPGNTELKGERALMRIRHMTGLGTIIQIPLWHSGFYISIKAPKESALLNLNQRIENDKVSLGRETSGMIFANTSSFFIRALMDFTVEHIYDTTLKKDLADDILSHISVLDIPTIIWAMAAVIWRRGFPYARAIVNQSGVQTHVVKEKVDITKLFWVDNSRLTPWQISHMTNKQSGATDLTILNRYREEFTEGKRREILLSDNGERGKVSMLLKNPSINDYLMSGQKWINSIVDMVDNALSVTNDYDQRDKFITDHGRSSNMRQMAHFVQEIRADSDVVKGLDDIEAILSDLSSETRIRDAYFKGIKDFSEDATMSIIAITVTEPGEVGPLPRFPHLLPIDAASVFFILLVQKINQIRIRQ